MSFLSRLLGTQEDPRERLRPLWHKVVGLARTPDFYSECGVADTVAGRFDMVSAVTACAMVRLEASELRAESAWLAELFVEDMEAQMRELGVNDVVVGKRMGKVMSSLGGRLGAYRPALSNRDHEALADAVERNVTMNEHGSASCAADRLLAMMQDFASLSDDAFLAAEQIA